MTHAMDGITGRKRGALLCAGLLFGAVVLISACVNASPTTPRVANMCKSQAGDGLWGGWADGAVDEGNGTVSFITRSFGDNVGTEAKLHLVNCGSGEAIGIERANYFDPEMGGRWSAKDPEWRAIESSDDFYTRLRAVSDVSNVESLRPLQTRYGFEVERMWADGTSQHAICACKLYYPDQIGDWTKTKRPDAAALN